MIKKFLFFILMSSFSITSAQLPVEAHQKIKVAIFKDTGARPRNNLPEAIDASPDMALTIIDGEELREGHLRGFDLVIIPGGSAKKESMTMKDEGRKEVLRFVAQGGLYIGICAGCYLLTDARPTDLGLLPLGIRDSAHWARGKGEVLVELTALGKEIFGVKETMLEILYHNGPVVDTSRLTPAAHFVPLGFFRSELVNKAGKRGVMLGAPAMFLGSFGRGLVLGISPHPEASTTEVQMEINAIRWLYSHRK